MVLHGRVVHDPPADHIQHQHGLESSDEPYGVYNKNDQAAHSAMRFSIPRSSQQQQPQQQPRSRRAEAEQHQGTTTSGVRSSRTATTSSSSNAVRDSMQRRSTFYRLKEDVQEYRKQVDSLAETLRGLAGTGTARKSSAGAVLSPEEAWRLRILMKNAVDKDQTLWGQLYQYETTLHQQSSQEQTDCMKLHRVFNRCHKSLVMCLSLIEENRGNNAVLRQLGWTGLKKMVEAKEEETLDDRFQFQPIPPPLPRTDGEPQEDELDSFYDRGTVDFSFLEGKTPESDDYLGACITVVGDYVCGELPDDMSSMGGPRSRRYSIDGSRDKSSSKRRQGQGSTEEAKWSTIFEMLKQDMTLFLHPAHRCGCAEAPAAETARAGKPGHHNRKASF